MKHTMPDPPTPVLDCPLVYLEIRDGVFARAYNSSHSHGAFTLTIEGERRVDAGMGTIIVIIRKQTQQVVSLRLTETGEGSRFPSDMVTINKQANRLCICLPGKPQTILVQFEEKRDFSVAVCLLQKAGFHISDALPTSLLTNPPTHDTTPDYGPLLSSITPLSLLPLDTSRGPETQHDLSFTAMLATPSQPSRPSTISDPRILHTQRHVSVPVQPYPVTNQVVNTSPVAAQLNPYNMFLGVGNTNSHVPRVSSPLKHSFVPNLPSTHSPSNGIGAFSYPNALPPGFVSYSPIVHGNFGPSSLEHSQNNDASSYKANTAVWNEATSGPVHYQSIQDRPQEYRNLMPQPRKLPFESNKKGYKAGGRSEPQGTKRVEVGKAHKLRKTGDTTRSFTETTSRGSRKVQATDISRKKANIEHQSSARDVMLRKASVLSDSSNKRGHDAPASNLEVALPTKKPKQDIYEDAQCQTDIQSEQNGASGSLETTGFREKSSGHDVSPLVVVTDLDTLKDLHEATATLFNKYGKEVENCGDQARHAELYLDQIWEMRKDFWLKRLRDNVDVQWHGKTDEFLPPLDSAA